MGAGRFIESAAAYGVSISGPEAKSVVDDYRGSYAEIPKFWYALESAAVSAVQTPGRVFWAGPIAYCVVGRTLYAKLPSGRKIAYSDPQVKHEQTQWGERPKLSYMTVDAKTKRWVLESTYGGKLCENVVQGVARDFLVVGLFRCEDAGYPVIFHVHDEIVCEVPIGFGSVAEVEKLMTTLPKWGDRCPLAAEGFESERYRK
jgi:DNA polymerase